MSKLIGTSPNQVPSNADLGTAAFLDTKELLLSKGSELSRIDAIINETTTDVFVYDTSFDSDNGAWRKRTSHTSWYNEKLNTEDRGSRRDFPSVVVIIATVSNVTIYDADDPSLPMWMRFRAGTTGMEDRLLLQSNSSDPITVHMLNGVLAIAWKNESSSYGSPIVNFISELTVRMDSQADGTEGGTWNGNIAQRNTNVLGYYRNSTIDYDLPASQVNHVSMGVIPGTPINPATGLPNPTILASTPDGIGIIRYDGNVMTIANGSDDVIMSKFNSKFDVVSVWQTGSGDAVYQFPFEKWIANDIGIANNDEFRWNDAGWSGTNNVNSADIDRIEVIDDDYIAFAGDYTNDADYWMGLNLHSPNSYPGGTATQSSDKALWANIRDTHTTGWMPGNPQLVCFSDTSSQPLVDYNLANNSGFDSDTVWTKSGQIPSDWTISGGVANIADTSRTGDNFLYQEIDGGLIPGRQYIVKITWNLSVGDFDVRLGGSNTIFSIASTYGSSGTKTFSLTAGSTNDRLEIIANQHAVGTFDDFELYLAEQDRTARKRGIEVHGVIKRIPVAPGADLVGYSNFGTGNHLTQEYTTDLDFGTGDMSVACWFRHEATTGEKTIFRRFGSTITGGFVFRMLGTTSAIQFGTRDTSGNWVSPSSGQAFDDGIWHMAVGVRRCSGTTARVEIWIDGQLLGRSQSANASIDDATSQDAILNIGSEGGTTNFWDDGELALGRISGLAPSPEQIKKMYEDEKVLFRDNAKATLVGNANNINGMAFDKGTHLLHVGTSAGRSVFQGLRRVEETTDEVTVAISAANGLVAED